MIPWVFKDDAELTVGSYYVLLLVAPSNGNHAAIAEPSTDPYVLVWRFKARYDVEAFT